MSKVFVITKGEYSDYHICGVALDRKKAEKLAKKFFAEVETFETDVRILTTSALALKGFIKKQPTAYDVDKVVEELKQLKGYTIRNGVMGITAVKEAIEIVKVGGKDD